MEEASTGSEGQRPFTRRVFARRVGGAVLAAPFLSLLDGVALARPPVAKSPPLEQHLDPGVRITTAILRPPTRISKGSSTATRSSRANIFSAPSMRVIDLERSAFASDMP